MYSYSELRNEAPVGAPGAAGGAKAAARTQCEQAAFTCSAQLQYCRQQQKQSLYFTIHVLNLREALVRVQAYSTTVFTTQGCRRAARF